MYAELTRQQVKALNRLDRRRRMKYDGRHKEKASAQELRAAREEVEVAEVRDESEFSRAAHRYSPGHR